MISEINKLNEEIDWLIHERVTLICRIDSVSRRHSLLMEEGGKKTRVRKRRPANKTEEIEIFRR